MSEKPLESPPQDTEAKKSCQQSLIKHKHIAFLLAMSLLASQLDLGVIADMLSILVNVCHLWQLVISWRADNA